MTCREYKLSPYLTSLGAMLRHQPTLYSPMSPCTVDYLLANPSALGCDVTRTNYSIESYGTTAGDRSFSSSDRSFSSSLLDDDFSPVKVTVSSSSVDSLDNCDDVKLLISPRYKTELCRSFKENGRCRYGSKCQYAHGDYELRSVGRHPKYKTELCRTYHETGFCSYGPRCNFVHETSELCRASPARRCHQSLVMKDDAFCLQTQLQLMYPAGVVTSRCAQVSGCSGSLNNSIASLSDSSPPLSRTTSPTQLIFDEGLYQSQVVP